MREREEHQQADTLTETAFSSAFFRWLYYWGPAVLWMVGIFFFSSRPAPLGPLSESSYSELIGRVGHVAEYAGLAALLHRALENEGQKHALPLSFGIAMAYAVSDELHQGFVPGRECSLTDVGRDAVGALLALTCIWVRRITDHRPL